MCKIGHFCRSIQLFMCRFRIVLATVLIHITIPFKRLIWGIIYLKAANFANFIKVIYPVIKLFIIFFLIYFNVFVLFFILIVICVFNSIFISFFIFFIIIVRVRAWYGLYGLINCLNYRLIKTNLLFILIDIQFLILGRIKCISYLWFWLFTDLMMEVIFMIMNFINFHFWTLQLPSFWFHSSLGIFLDILV